MLTGDGADQSLPAYRPTGRGAGLPDAGVAPRLHVDQQPVVRRSSHRGVDVGRRARSARRTTSTAAPSVLVRILSQGKRRRRRLPRTRTRVHVGGRRRHQLGEVGSEVQVRRCCQVAPPSSGPGVGRGRHRTQLPPGPSRSSTTPAGVDSGCASPVSGIDGEKARRRRPEGDLAAGQRRWRADDVDPGAPARRGRRGCAVRRLPRSRNGPVRRARRARRHRPPARSTRWPCRKPSSVTVARLRRLVAVMVAGTGTTWPRSVAPGAPGMTREGSQPGARVPGQDPSGLDGWSMRGTDRLMAW